MMPIRYPEFFAGIPGIVVRDPLAELLGAAEGGCIEYRFLDAVKLAGHSCPTVAGAWLMATRGLRALYGGETPLRGGVQVDFAEAEDSGVAGVIASVMTLLTGAAGAGGFKGLAGQFSRRDLLHFGVSGIAGIRMTRRDTGLAVQVSLDLSSVPPDPRIGQLLGELLSGNPDVALRSEFGRLWQDRVKRILIDHHDDPALVAIV